MRRAGFPDNHPARVPVVMIDPKQLFKVLTQAQASVMQHVLAAYPVGRLIDSVVRAGPAHMRTARMCVCGAGGCGGAHLTCWCTREGTRTRHTAAELSPMAAGVNEIGTRTRNGMGQCAGCR